MEIELIICVFRLFQMPFVLCCASKDITTGSQSVQTSGQQATSAVSFPDVWSPGS